jgi:hypothetical protein
MKQKLEQPDYLTLLISAFTFCSLQLGLIIKEAVLQWLPGFWYGTIIIEIFVQGDHVAF